MIRASNARPYHNIIRERTLMEIKATTTYSYAVYKDFIRFSLNKGKYYKLKQRLLVLIIGLGLLEVIFFKKTTEDNSFSWLLTVLVIMCLAVFIFMYFVYPKIAFKSAKKMANIKNEYIFKIDELVASANTPEISANAILKYSMIYKVYETDKYFFFYIQKQQAYILEKKEIVNGTAEQIREAVSKCMPEKSYIICN